jgi:site-specific DNA recombinase
VDAFNQIIADRERYIEALSPILETLTDATIFDRESEILAERSAGLFAQLESLVTENARHMQDQGAYQQRYDELTARYDGVKQRLAEIAAERKQRQLRREKILAFIETLRQRDALLTDFDENLWRSTVEQLTIYAGNDVAVTFRDGKTIHCDVRLKRYAKN